MGNDSLILAARVSSEHEAAITRREEGENRITDSFIAIPFLWFTYSVNFSFSPALILSLSYIFSLIPPARVPDPDLFVHLCAQQQQQSANNRCLNHDPIC